MNPGFSRRALLERVGTAATVASLSGCLDDVPLVGENDESYLDWIPNDDDVTPDYTDFSVTAPSTLAAHKDELHELFSLRRQMRAGQDLVSGGIGWTTEYEDIETIVGYGSIAEAWFDVHVYYASYSGDELADRLEELNYEADSTHRGFELYRRATPDPGYRETERATLEQLGKGQVVAFDGDVAVSATLAGGTSASPISKVRAAIDAMQGDANRYLDANDDAAEVTDHLRDGDDVLVWLHPEFTEYDVNNPGSRVHFEGQVGKAHELDIDSGTSTFRTVFLFASRDDADEAAFGELIDTIRSYEVPFADQNSDIEDETPYEDVELDTSRSGRAVVLEGTQATAKLRRTPFWF